MPSSPLPPPAQQRAIISQAAQHAGIDPAVLFGVYGTETSFGKDLSTSSAGAVGPFQFEPGTARSLGVDPNNFRSAAFGAARYLAQFKGRGTAGMLSAYNAGPAGGIQQGYVQKVLNYAKQWPGHGDIIASSARDAQHGAGTVQTQAPAQTRTIQPPAPLGVVAPLLTAKSAYDIGPRVPGLGSPIAPLKAAGLLTTPPPQTVTTPGNAPATSPQPQPTNAAAGGNRHAGFFLPAGAKYLPGRADQGRDGQTNPGGPIIAPGDGYVVAVKSDPGGFGPSYPVVHFTSGPYAGQDIYLGHTIAAKMTGARFRAGDTLSHTGTHGIGNATVPGWFEIGYAGGGSPGPFGQKTPF